MLRNGVMYAHSRDARVAAAAIVDAIVKATAETYGVASGDVRGWLESMREDPWQQRERARRGVLLIVCEEQNLLEWLFDLRKVRLALASTDHQLM